MPVITAPVNELQEHVFMPIMQQLLHRLLVLLGLDRTIDNKIYINTDWSTHSETNDDKEEVQFGTNVLRVDANVQMNPTSQKFDVYTFKHTGAYGISPATLNRNMPIYLDFPNRVRINEMRSPCTIVMNCEIQLHTEDAFALPQQLFQKWENGQVYQFNDLTFDYPIPKYIISVLYGLWQMDRINGKPAGKNFRQFIRLHTGTGWQVHKHRELKERELVCPVHDLMVLTSLEYSDDRPSGVMEGRLPIGFTVPFIYTVQFALPAMVILDYPVIYNNQLVPSRYLPNQTDVRRFNNLTETRPTFGLDLYHKAYGGRHAMPLQMPEYDIWRVPTDSGPFAYNKFPCLIVAALVDNEETLECVEDFSVDFDTENKLTPIIKEILYQQGEESVEYDAIYTIAVYKYEKQLCPYKDYTFDEDLKIHFKAANLTAQYHIVIFTAENLLKINRKWWGLLFKYFRFINPQLRDQIRQLFYKGDLGGNFPWGCYIDDDGNIYDRDGNLIGHISDISTEARNAYHQARIFRNYIIARETAKS